MVRLSIILVIVFTECINAQEFQWGIINPWRYPNITQLKVQQDGLYFLSDNSYLIQVNENLNEFDTIVSDFILPINDFAIDDNGFAYLTSSLTNGEQGVFEYNIESKDWQYLFGKFGLIELWAIENEVFVAEKPTPIGFGAKQLGKIESDTFFVLLEHESIEPNYYFHNDVIALFDEDEGDDDILYLSKDDGLTWNNLTTPIKSIYGVTVTSNNELSIYGSSWIVYAMDLQSFSIVDSFQYFDEDYQSWLPKSIYSVEFIADEIYVSNFFYTEKSNDNGLSWSNLSNAINEGERRYEEFVKFENRIFMATSFGLEYFDPANSKFKSLNEYYISNISHVEFTADSSLYLSTLHTQTGPSELFNSSNRGRTWKSKGEILEVNGSAQPKNVYFINHEQAYVIDPNDSIMYKSIDGAETWIPHSIAPFPQGTRFNFLDVESIYAYFDNQIFFSSDEGFTWNELAIPDVIPFSSFRIEETEQEFLWLINVQLGTEPLVHLYKVQNEEVVFIDSLSFSTYNYAISNEELLYLAVRDSLFVYSGESNSLQETCERDGNDRILHFYGDSLLVYRENNLFWEEEHCETSFNYIIELPTKNLAGYNSFKVIQMDKELILFANTGNIVKYGPPIDKSQYTGSEELEADKIHFSVYPNPFTNQLIIDTEENLFHRLYNTSGQLVMESYRNIISTTGLSSGMYFVVSYDEKGVMITNSIVKQ